MLKYFVVGVFFQWIMTVIRRIVPNFAFKHLVEPNVTVKLVTVLVKMV